MSRRETQLDREQKTWAGRSTVSSDSNAYLQTEPS